MFKSRLWQLAIWSVCSATLTTPSDRDRLVQYLRAQLVGPADGPSETLTDIPHRRYVAGILYPRGASAEAHLDDEDPDENGSGEDEQENDAVRLTHEWDPSSLAISFFLPDGHSLEVAVWGARYKKSGKVWERVAIAEESDPLSGSIDIATGTALSRTPTLDGRAFLVVKRRPIAGGRLLTVGLVNAAVRQGAVDPSDCLLQVGLRCISVGGPFAAYPEPSLGSASVEEQELRLLYRNRPHYAVGHGCAAEWDTGDAGPTWVAASVLPSVEVPPISQTVVDLDGDVLQLARLADPDTLPENLVGLLGSFVDAYGRWREKLVGSLERIPGELEPAACRSIDRIDQAIGRMRRGLDLLLTDPEVLRAFRLANLAVSLQMRHTEDDLAGMPHERGTVDPRSAELGPYRWYPFQLGFLLLVLESVAHDDSEDRDLVDLLWFPTGGGKTEAYLAAAALVILLRRIRHGDEGAGLAVLTRYTLRLLSNQQFQRAATLICALERIRQDEGDLGSRPIAIGLWVGESVSPNTGDAAVEKVQALLEDPHPRNPFPLQRCPWCGTLLVPTTRTDDVDAYGFSTVVPFTVRCVNETCPFHRLLPVVLVDDALYEDPPALVLATLDKLARLAWLAEPSGLFSAAVPGPDLILQDELHLITGPLGTTAGLYERAISGIFRLRGARPKVIAATATTRNSGSQVSAFMGRRVAVFPPSGFDVDDAFFAHTDHSAQGRVFMGVVAQGHTVATTIVHAAAAALQGTMECGLSAAAADAYGTLVVYCNSLRELGRSMSLAADDIPARIKATSTDESKRVTYDSHRIVELTGNVPGDELPGLLDRVKLPASHPDGVTMLCTTNMLSVGVDIPRLGLMLMNGQPKTAAEYIQATSRVGRSVEPGLIVTVLSGARPRDLSQFEGFVPFHRSLYRHVEPASLTPFSLPSRLRALHAALVIVVRHGLGFAADAAAGDFDPLGPGGDRARKVLIEGLDVVDPVEADATRHHLDTLLAEWEGRRQAAVADGKALHYRGVGRNTHKLLTDFGLTDGWPTLHSMRSVDRSTEIKVLGER